MWILIWRILMLVMALVILGFVIWMATNFARSSRRQVNDVRSVEREQAPDIEDASYTEADDERAEGSDGK